MYRCASYHHVSAVYSVFVVLDRGAEMQSQVPSKLQRYRNLEVGDEEEWRNIRISDIIIIQQQNIDLARRYLHT